MRTLLCIFVPGVPQPGGSKRGFFIKKINRVVITDANKKAAGWKQLVTLHASSEYKDEPYTGPLSVTITFQLLRPKGHYGSGSKSNILKASSPKHPTSKPDATKLVRSTEDALTGVVWKDDAQIVHQEVRKIYAERSGAAIVVRALECLA